MQIENYIERLQKLNEKMVSIEKCLDIDAKKQLLAEYEKQEEDPNLWNDQQAIKRHSQKKKAVEHIIKDFSSTRLAVDDFSAMVELAGECEVQENELLKEAQTAEKLVDELWLDTLLNKKYDDCDAIVTLHAGAGGEEAQDWTEMLSRMYLRYAELAGFSATIIDEMPGDGAGLKSQTIQFEGTNAYGYLKCEKGVHRLVRCSPFDSQNRRHTSFSSVEVSPILEDNTEIEIKADDLRIDTYRSSGAGGQHVNKTDSAIRITHLPTGIVVQCQNERSQIQNKETAMNMLKGKLAQLAEERRQKENAEIKGESKKNEWGSQIRSYVLHPYNMVKDHRTNYETSNTTAVLDGEIQPFINEFLKVDA